MSNSGNWMEGKGGHWGPSTLGERLGLRAETRRLPEFCGNSYVPTMATSVLCEISPKHHCVNGLKSCNPPKTIRKNGCSEIKKKLEIRWKNH